MNHSNNQLCVMPTYYVMCHVIPILWSVNIKYNFGLSQHFLI